MIVLGLGSNVGDRLEYLTRAVNKISKSLLAGIEISSIYESVAVLKKGSPEDWDNKYLNLAVRGETHLSPSDLLKNIKMKIKYLTKTTIITIIITTNTIN